MAKKPDKDDIFGQIDANLRRVFEEDAAEDLPPKLLDLLDKLDKIDAPKQRAPAGTDRK